MQGRRNEFKSSGSKSGKLKNWLVPLHQISKSSGSTEPLEPPLTPALVEATRVDGFKKLA